MTLLGITLAAVGSYMLAGSSIPGLLLVVLGCWVCGWACAKSYYG